MNHSRSELAHLLSRTLGLEKAQDVITRTADSMGLGDSLAHDDALALLDRIAQEPGLVGICSRFAKSRLLLLTS